MPNERTIFLIGGSSNVGKSTLAQLLAAHLGWTSRSTDKLARHPGRPWQTAPNEVPAHVAEHYLSLSVEDLLADVLRHYRDNVFPLIQEVVLSQTTGKLVLEGSALWPEIMTTPIRSSVAAIWLTAGDDLFEQRIYAASQYQTKSARDKAMIDKFLARTILYNARMMEAVNRLGLVSIHVERTTKNDDLMHLCLAALKRQSFERM